MQSLIIIVDLMLILYINSVSLSVCQSVCRGPETRITFNKIVPSNSRAQKLFRTSSSYFLLLLLHPFPCSNCRRRWGKYFWAFNKTVPPNSRAQKLFKTSSSYFLLLLLRPFLRNNCHRRWGKYFWDLEGG
jgi:hypothetical protein